MVETELALAGSPLAPGRTAVRIRVRDIDGSDRSGHRAPLIVLHGAWGYEVYPFDRQIAALRAERRLVIPDRSGYGGSDPVDGLAVDYHQRGAEETLALMDALAIERASLWGHSDGAIIALLLALMAPTRVDAIVAEATHFYRRKPQSRAFFETMRDEPDRFGDRIVAALERDHGVRWRAVLAAAGDAWLRIAEQAPSDRADFYDGRLSRLDVPSLFVHGGRDPRTEPGELDALRAAVSAAPVPHRFAVFDAAGHSPHTESASADAVTQAAVEFLG